MAKDSATAEIERFVTLVSGCKDCPMHLVTQDNCVDGYGATEECEVLIVLDTAECIDLNRFPTTVKTALTQSKISLSKVRYTSALRCTGLGSSWHGDDKALRSLLRDCRKHIDNELALYKPKVIINIGKLAKYVTTGSWDKDYKNNLNTISKIDERYYISVKNPLLGMTPKEYREFSAVFKKVNNLLLGITYPNDAKYIVIDRMDQLDKAEKLLMQTTELVFDFEVCTNLDKVYNYFDPQDKLLCIGFCWAPGRAICLPLDHKEIDPAVAKRSTEIVKKILRSPIKKVAHNAMYDSFAAYHFFNGLEVQNVHFDTMLAHHVLDPTARTHSLKYLTNMYTTFGGYEEAIHEHLGPTVFPSYGEVPYDVLGTYCCVDVDMTYRLKQQFATALANDEALERVFKEITMPSYRVFLDIRKRGMYVNKKRLLDIKTHYEDLRKKAIVTLYANEHVIKHTPTLNIASPKQLQFLLFDALKLKTMKPTASGQNSTDEEVIHRLASYYKRDKKINEILEAILTIRKANKLIGTYIDGMIKHIDATGYVYSSYMLHGTETGRLSSSNPNLANIPAEYDLPEHLQIKSAFEAPPDYMFVSADYSQIELRNIGNYSLDPCIVDAYLAELDMHAYTGSLIFGIDIDAVEKYMRKIGKTTNFGGVFGAGAKTLANQIEKEGALSDEELLSALDTACVRYNVTDRNFLRADEREELMIVLAKYIQKTIFYKWHRLKEWQEEQRRSARANKSIRTGFGRIRYLQYPPNPTKSQLWTLDNLGVNTPVQSLSADCLFLAMIKLSKIFKERKFKSYMVGQVYDSINFYVHKDEIEQVLPIIKTVMEVEPLTFKPEFFTIPMIVDLEIGTNWANLKELDDVKYDKTIYA